MITGLRDSSRDRAWHLIAGTLFIAVCLWLLTANIIFGDEGFFLVIYDQFLRAPEHVARATSSFWLTNVIGSAWLRIAPLPGVLAMRVGSGALDVAGAAIAWSTTRRLGSPEGWPALLAAGMAIASGYIYVEYTGLTSLALAAACALILAGLERSRLAPLACAGGVLGAAVFLRLPNVLLPSLVLAPFVVAAIERRSMMSAVRPSATLAGGVLVGLAAVGALVAMLHAGGDIRASVTDMLNANGSAHAPSRLIRDVGRTVILSAIHGAGCWLVAAIASAAAARWPARRHMVTAAVVFAVVAAHAWLPAVDWRYSVLGLTALAIGRCLVDAGAPRGLRRMSVLSAWMLILLGAGSASLPWPLLAGLWLALPVAFLRFGQTPSSQLRAVLVAVILFGVVPVRPYLAALTGGRPTLWPHDLTAVPHDARLRPLHTSQALASATDELLNALPSFVHAGDAMITTNGIPLVTYLAGARTFYPHPYIDLVGVRRFDEYDAAADWRGPWPIWVRAKFMPTADFAVTHLPGSTFVDTEATREAVASHLVARGYAKAWENDLFEIWTPPRDHAR